MTKTKNKPKTGSCRTVSSIFANKTVAARQQQKISVTISGSSKTLQALTSAAVVLPGLLLPTVQAADGDHINFQFSRYQEGKRNLFGLPNSQNPIRADVLHGSGLFTLTDRAKFSFGYTQDIWSGATPITTTPLAANPYSPILKNTPEGVAVSGASPLLNPDNVFLDRDLNFIRSDTGEQDLRSVLVLSSASPETRNQANFRLSYEWDEAEINAGAGFSLERDYRSSFGSLGGRLDFNQKLTSVKFGVGYTSSSISAILDHDAAPYLTKTAFDSQIERREDGAEILRAERQDWAANLGLTQVLTKYALIDANLGYTYGNGYLENPYKAVTTIFVDPDVLNNGLTTPVLGDVRALLEQRPNQRSQWAFSTKYIQHVNPLDAALHLNYRFSTDDWGINTNTFSANWIQPLPGGWTLTPRIRYYSQDAADFYQPYLITQQNFSTQAVDNLGREVWVDSNNPEIEYVRDENFNLLDSEGNIVNVSDVQPKTIPFDAGKLPDDFSSDHRLAGFGALSGGVTLRKQFARGITLEAGFEYYTRASSLKLGSDGGNSFADFDYYVANAALILNLENMRLSGSSGHTHQHAHSGKNSTSANMHHHSQPAGLMFAHMLDDAGEFMLGYRFMYSRMAGSMLHGTSAVSDPAIVNQGCGTENLCTFRPADMDMRMHMLDIMYAPTRWLNLMLMPRFMDMEMNLRELDGRLPAPAEEHKHFGGHATGVIGDTLIVSLFKLYEKTGHRLHAGLGISAPTGKSDLQFRRVFKIDGGSVHFGMQLGSGTWDFVPSLTYTGDYNRWSWGAQVSGVKRMENRNESGYRLGDQFQATSWGGYGLTRWLTASVRGVYTLQDRIHGDFNSFNARIGPMDFPKNYGGQFWNVGFGVNAVIPDGRFAGHHFGFEWLQPVHTDVNGFQLDRKGALTASWSYRF
ncbi:Protein of unknown function [Nitrosomonas sp. Nm51]|uniref:DUF3570 domain-containing protein n=1 Tax=Nitrosomonas sp. Nm51 TaxID=133720 RepID=UPI0008C6B132|nr:DUF3570 domain-containing protein [Nitrosomonas sp. Nm51]SER70777.1 Protein of unknown function [Nitrosomonas sp. Nm51]